VLVQVLSVVDAPEDARGVPWCSVVPCVQAGLRLGQAFSVLAFMLLQQTARRFPSPSVKSGASSGRRSTSLKTSLKTLRLSCIVDITGILWHALRIGSVEQTALSKQRQTRELGQSTRVEQTVADDGWVADRFPLLGNWKRLTERSSSHPWTRACTNLRGSTVYVFCNQILLR